MQSVHFSPFQGTWYPERRAELERLLQDRLEESRARIGCFPFTEALAFVTPHAGPAYSGTVAAAAYRALQLSKPERIVVLAFPHHGGLRGIAVPDVDAISTPLGEVAISPGLAGEFPPVAEERVCDHSFEIQLPFLQQVAPQARVAPLYVGRTTAGERARAASALASEWRPGTVFVASSDFTHYGRDFGFVPFPTDGSAPRRLHELDGECIEAAGSLDSSLFRDTLRETAATVCGSEPIALLLDILTILGGDDIYQSTLDYQTSGEITGDYHHSVSYAALGYCRREALQLTPADCEALLDSAAETLACLRGSGRREPVEARGSSALGAQRGVFVSLHQGEKLLGCLGNCSGREPLSVQVPDLAVSAALEDPRFRPAAEVAGPIDIEISVLTPFKRITSADQLRVHRHGAMLRLGECSGLLLPQVADRYDWTGEQFLEAVTRKSMLGPHAWKDPQARLSVFEAQVFSRPGLPGRS